MSTEFEIIQKEGLLPIKAWIKGVPLEDQAREQLLNISKLPFVEGWVAAMPDVHWGMGATVGSVIPLNKAIIPAAVGVDIGCGMMAVRTSLNAKDLPDNLSGVRKAIERTVPHGRTDNGGKNDRGAFKNPPRNSQKAFKKLLGGYENLIERHSSIRKSNSYNHMGTLGTGNHFIEICLDESDSVWIMLHSGSRGVGNKIGTYFIELAKQDMRKWFINLPDINLAYFPEGTDHFNDYVFAVNWAQDFAKLNRQTMMENIISALGNTKGIKGFKANLMAVNCHHNYVTKEQHLGKSLWITRKGAVRAREGDLGIIPGSMGARSYIVRGKGSADSFHSCSHGAGRAMSRRQAKKQFTIEDHVKATLGVECKKDASVLDETPGAYKSIDAVMEAQKDLVEIVHTLKQVVCVKG